MDLEVLVTMQEEDLLLVLAAASIVELMGTGLVTAKQETGKTGVIAVEREVM